MAEIMVAGTLEPKMDTESSSSAILNYENKVINLVGLGSGAFEWGVPWMLCVKQRRRHVFKPLTRRLQRHDTATDAKDYVVVTTTVCVL